MNGVGRKYVILGSLCALVLTLAVGYAAFNAVLNIKGTTNINSNWDIKITKITPTVLNGTPSDAKVPEGVGTLTASFETNLVSPGDSMQYVITITNNGSINATLEKISVSKPDNEYITFETSGLAQGSTLTANGGTADLTVTVTYKDIAEGQQQPENTKGTLSVTLDYVQEGTGSGSAGEIASDYTGVLYSKNVLTNTNIDDWTDEDWVANSINTGDTAEKIKGYAQTSSDTMGKFYLKHIMTNGQVESSEVCFITDTEHCMKPNEYETSKTLIQSQELWFTSNGGYCYFSDSTSYCLANSLNVDAESAGDVRVDDGSVYCLVRSDGYALCYAY